MNETFFWWLCHVINSSLQNANITSWCIGAKLDTKLGTKLSTKLSTKIIPYKTSYTILTQLKARAEKKKCYEKFLRGRGDSHIYCCGGTENRWNFEKGAQNIFDCGSLLFSKSARAFFKRCSAKVVGPKTYFTPFPLPCPHGLWISTNVIFMWFWL